MNFEAYLISKRIDLEAFKASEPSVWEAWKLEFDQMHPNSFTIQKLNLINPIRRKYPLKEIPEVKTAEKKEEPSTLTPPDVTSTPTVAPTTAKPAVARPVFKPKPKIN